MESSTKEATDLRRRTPTRWLVIGAVVLVVLVLLQRRGQLVHDTRLDLLLNPQDFLSSAKSLWTSSEDFGRVQSQTVGYAFPMGPFMLVGDVLGLPAWITERLWIGLLLGLAWWGTARLADELRIGTPATRVLGSAAFALSPFFIGRAGGISAFVQPAALLPWAILPLVTGSRVGSPRRAACRSAVAIAVMGGANAAGTLAVLVVPVMWLATREPGPRRRALSTWWSASALAAMSWWLFPLLIQGRFGIDAFPISEQASLTTLFTAPFEVLRGTADWVGQLRFFDEPSLLPAWIVVHSGWIIVGSGILAAFGLVGLAVRSLPEKRFLRITLLVGVALVGSGYGGTAGNPFAGAVVDLLGSRAFEAFRNVYKFQPVVLLPLAMGIVHLLPMIWRLRVRGAQHLARAASAALVALVAVGAHPLLTQRFLGPASSSFREVPAWWVSAGEYLDEAPGRSLLVPGLSKSASTWGVPQDEPLTWLTDQPWATRNQVPMGSYGATRYLDVVEKTISIGGDARLGDFLDRGGIARLVVRNDGRWFSTNAPPPAVVNDALVASGLVHVESFGPVGQGDRLFGASGLHPIEIYEVGGGAQETRAAVFPADTAAVVSGDSSSLMALSDWGLTGRALIFVEDLGNAERVPPLGIVTDGDRRRNTSFGLSRNNEGFTLGRHDRDPNVQLHDAKPYPDVQVGDQVVKSYGDVAWLAASSYGSLLVPLPRWAPALSIDGDESTSWKSAGERPVVGEWVEYHLARPHRFEDGITIQLRRQHPLEPGAVTIRTTTDQGSRLTRVAKNNDVQVLNMAPGQTRAVRLTIEAVAGAEQGVGIAEVGLSGLDVDDRLVVPDLLGRGSEGEGHPQPIYVFSRAPLSTKTIVPLEQERVLRRRFNVPRDGKYSLQAKVSAAPSRRVLQAIGTTPTMTIDATATAGDLPRNAPRHLIDRDPASAWFAPAPDTDGRLSETITLRWSEPRLVDGFTVTGVSGFRLPTRVEVASGADVRAAKIGPDGGATFAPFTSDHMSITLFADEFQITVPLALAEIDVPALSDLVPGPIDVDAPIVVGCADGPSVTVGNSERRFSVDATVGDLFERTNLGAVPCEGDALDLGAGEVDLDAHANGAPLTIESVLLADPGIEPQPERPLRGSNVRSWNNDSRRIAVGPGAAAYLMITENFNEGWVARMNGKELKSLVLDGWEQGFFVPAGDGGAIVLEYEPNGAYRAAMAIGSLLALLVLAGAVLRARGRTLPPLVERTLHPVLACLLVVSLSVLIGGVAAVLVVPLAFVARRHRAALPGAIGALVGCAAIVAGVSEGLAGGPYGDTVTILTVVAVVAFAVTVLEGKRTPEQPD